MSHIREISSSCRMCYLHTVFIYRINMILDSLASAKSAEWNLPK